MNKRIIGLQEFGFSRDSVHRLMMAPSKGRRVAKKYHGAVDARVTKLRNDDRDYTELTHYGRADQKLNQEWHAIRTPETVWRRHEHSASWAPYCFEIPP